MVIKQSTNEDIETNRLLDAESKSNLNETKKKQWRSKEAIKRLEKALQDSNRTAYWSQRREEEDLLDQPGKGWLT